MNPLPRFTDPAHLAEAFERCAPGGRVVYATGPWTLDAPGNATLAMVELLRRQGRASGLARGKDPREDGRFFHYLYRALSSDPAGEPDRGASTDVRRSGSMPGGAAWEASDEGRLYRLIEDLATRGEPCPSNEEVHELLELRSRDRANYCFRKLYAAGLIENVEPARYGPRVLKVVATGKRTAAAPDGFAQRRRDAEEKTYG